MAKRKEIFLQRKQTKQHPKTRESFLESFRWQKTKGSKSSRRFFTKYKIEKHRVCHQHLCKFLKISGRDLAKSKRKQKENPKTRGRKKNIPKNEALENFFKALPMERSHYCLHSEHLFIQGFSTLLSLFREYRRVGEIVVSKAKFFTYFNKEIYSQGIRIKKLKKDVCDTCLSLHQK